MASAPSAESAVAAPSTVAAPPASTAGAAAAAAPAVVGFQTKKLPGAPAAASASANAPTVVAPERMAYLEATLAKLPELDLSEMARLKSCFLAALGEGRENIVNGLELRVVLGDLGLYPSEEELKMVLRAYRDRVNLVGLARYLRLYKKEFWLNQVAARSGKQQQQQQPYAHTSQQNAHTTNGGGNAGRRQLTANAATGASAASPPSGPGVGHTYTAFSGSHARPANGGGGGGGGGSSGSDEDTLRAFVALGGEEDGSGEISATTLRDAVRGFGLTIDIDAMIRLVDVHHSGMLDYVDFCALWAAPADAHGVDSMGNALRQASADAEHRASLNGGSPSKHGGGGGANRRLMSVLQSPSHRSSVAAGAMQQRRSYVMSSGYEAGMSQPMTPRLGVGNGTSRSPTAGDYGEGGEGPNAVAVRQPVVAAALPAPITEEEHALLVRMFLFPDQFESTTAAATAGGSDAAGRRGGARFMLPSRIAQSAAPNAIAGGAAGGTATAGSTTAAAAASARRASLVQRTSQKQLSRANKNGNGGSTGRTRSQTRRAGAGGTRGRKVGDNGGDHDDDLTADFFSPKNQNVYRPPSPMLLSMRNSTAYRNRVKRLEEQKHAARGGGDVSPQQGGQHAATMARDGGYSYGADADNNSRPAKSATW